MQQNTQYKCVESNNSTRTIEINGKKYVVVSHYTGSKDFKKVLCDIAFRQAFEDTTKSE